MSEHAISEALGLRPIDPNEPIDAETVVMPEDDESTEVVPYNENYPAIPEPDQELLQDIDFARENIKKVLAQGQDSLDELV